MRVAKVKKKFNGQFKLLLLTIHGISVSFVDKIIEQID